MADETVEIQGHRISVRNLVGGGKALKTLRTSLGLATSRRILQCLSTNGDGTGTKDQAGPAASYFIKPPVGKLYVLSSMGVYIEHAGNFKAENYGGAAALTNGILVAVKDSQGGIIHSLSPIPFKKTGHWCGLGTVTQQFIGSGAGNNLFLVSVDFLTMAENALILNGDAEEFLEIKTQDDLSANVVSQMAHADGYFLETEQQSSL